MVTVSASVEDQVKFVEFPTMIALISARNKTVGTGVGVGVTTTVT